MAFRLPARHWKNPLLIPVLSVMFRVTVTAFAEVLTSTEEVDVLAETRAGPTASYVQVVVSGSPEV